ncbi:hypothetical protein [Bdellovibrio sp. NC01]|uniref:hypothetical protein n=1 Tax=Bdellovibrio sp. NC01 TaxID=2220073 RepID=UPI00115A57DB|nr:hypothetical protein [Bdellovibrio sp. NC01]QDK36501.1 hypothetical protein DOE51_02260 [Bdellovibrio sp. NC01]
MQKKLSWIFSICAFVTGLLVCLYVFAKKDFAFTQNTFYHIQFARTYAKGIWNFADLGILSHSYFDKVFIDQHILYHLYLIPFLIFFSPFVATKVAMSVLIGIVLFLMHRILRKYMSDVMALALTVSFVFLGGNAITRVFWERPAPINFIAILFLLLLSQKQIGAWLWLIVGYAFSMVSFETAFLTAAFGCFFLFDFKNTSWKKVAALVSGVALSFVLAPFPVEKIKYFANLLYYNLFIEKKIREWQAAKEPADVLGLFLIIFLSAVCLRWFQKAKEEFSNRFTLTHKLLLASSGLLIVSLEVTRFSYLFCLLAFLIFAIALSEFRDNQKKWTEYTAKLVAVVFLICAVMNITALKKNFRGDSGTARDLEKFAIWYNGSEYRGKPFLVMSWEYWSPLFYNDRYTKAEPGFSVFIYDFKDSGRMQQLGRFVDRPDSLTWQQTRDLFAAWNTDVLLIEKAHRSYATIKSTQGYLVKIYEDEKFELLQLREPNKNVTQTMNNDCDGKALEGRYFASNLQDDFKYSAQPNKNFQSYVVLTKSSEDIAGSLYPFLKGHYLYWDKAEKKFYNSAKMLSTKKPYQAFELYRSTQCNKKDGKWIASRPGLNPERSEKEFLRTGLQESLNYLSRLISQNNGELPYDFEDENKFTDQSSSTFIRIHLGIWALCEQKELFKSDKAYADYSSNCVRALNAAYKNMQGPIEHKLGEWATLAYSYLSLQNTADWNDQLRDEFQDIHQIILGYYDAKSASELTPERDLFSYGEGLLYLLKTGNKDLPLEKYLNTYWDSYRASGNIFYIRWLSESLALAFEQTKKPLYAQRLHQLFLDAKSLLSTDVGTDMEGCLYGQMPGSVVIHNPHHLTGLLLEGLVTAKDLRTAEGTSVLEKATIQKMFTCVGRIQRTSWNLPFTGNKENALGGIPLSYDNDTLKADLQGHVTTAMGRMVQWDAQ